MYFLLTKVARIAGLVIVAGALLVVMFVPQFRKIALLHAEQQRLLEQKSVESQMMIKFVPPSADEKEQWALSEAELAKRLPHNPNIGDILTQLSHAARDAGITDITFYVLPEEAGGKAISGRRQTEQTEITVALNEREAQRLKSSLAGNGTLKELPREDLKSVEVRIELRSSYRQVAGLLDAIQQLERTLLIQKVTISREAQQPFTEIRLLCFYQGNK